MMEHGDKDFFQLKELHMRLKMLHIYFSIFANIEHSSPPPKKKVWYFATFEVEKTQLNVGQIKNGTQIILIVPFVFVKSFYLSVEADEERIL